MTDDAFDFGEESSLRDVPYRLYEPLWNQYDLSEIDLDISEWSTIKYLNDSLDDFHPDISNVPNDSGGLYLFWMKCPIITGVTEYPFYIGRALLTKGQNLRKRTKEYFQHYQSDRDRPKIKRMIRYWGNRLYLSYHSVADNNLTEDYEKKLINSLLLPFNTRIPDSEISASISAFPL